MVASWSTVAAAAGAAACLVATFGAEASSVESREPTRSWHCLDAGRIRHDAVTRAAALDTAAAEHLKGSDKVWHCLTPPLTPSKATK